MKQSFDSIGFGKAIKTKRVIDLGITTRVAGKQSKVSHSTISRIENGYLPDIGNFVKLCNWLKTQPSTFFINKTIK